MASSVEGTITQFDLYLLRDIYHEDPSVGLGSRRLTPTDCFQSRAKSVRLLSPNCVSFDVSESRVGVSGYHFLQEFVSRKPGWGAWNNWAFLCPSGVGSVSHLCVVQLPGLRVMEQAKGGTAGPCG